MQLVDLQDRWNADPKRDLVLARLEAVVKDDYLSGEDDLVMLMGTRALEILEHYATLAFSRMANNLHLGRDLERSEDGKRTEG